ncbi:MFS transporter [Leadbetterella byssophila]|uniref:MFS transporter n=1 Tax=Leadbetterella byssophila TaxID=316068 RepID=UPI00399F7AC8
MSNYHKWVIGLLAFTQFTVVLDFMIMAPMGDLLIKSIGLTPSQFGIVVSAYAFSAGASGLLTAGFADRYDRKKLFLFFYIGFIVGTYMCGLATSYISLVGARIITGLFGGVIGSISMAIVTDIFPLEKRGRVMGFMQMGFGASQVLGIPLGLYFGHLWGWQSAFLAIASLALLIAIAIHFKLQPITEHLKYKQTQPVLQRLWSTFIKKEHRMGFITTAFLTVGGFMMAPFGSVFAINNLHVAETELPFMFMVAGVASLIIMPLIGKWSDKYSKLKIFTIAATWMSIMVVVYTHLGPSPFYLVLALNLLMHIGIMSRMTPSTALISAIPTAQDRGAFMSMNSSLQQLSGGIAAGVAGAIVYQSSPTSPLVHYDWVGYIVAGITLLSIGLLFRIQKVIQKRTPGI